MAEETKAVKDRFLNVDVGLERHGEKITLPEKPHPMTIREGLAALERLAKQEEADFALHEEIDALPMEGAVAFCEALKRIYGWANPVPTPGFFGPKPPTMVSVDVGVDANGIAQTIQIPWGRMEVPNIEGFLNTQGTFKNGLPIFVIGGTIKKKFTPQAKAIAELTRQIVREESIYRRKAVRLHANGADVDFDHIKFLDLTKVNPEELVFPEALMDEVDVNLFTPIENPEECRRQKIPLSRKILLEGPFGTGKTLSAYVAAQKGVKNGWTFVYLDRVSGIQQALMFATKFAPAIVFAEDIDRIMDGERDETTDDVLNTIDGVDLKGKDILAVFTSNNVNNIHPSMIRPGRLDAVITVGPPDASAVEKLFRIYGRDRLEQGTDLGPAASVLSGQIPAVVREVMERSKLYTIKRAAANGVNPQGVLVSGDDLFKSARGMEMHLKHLNRKEEKPSDAETLASALGKVVATYGGAAFRAAETDVSDAVSDIDSRTSHIKRVVEDIHRKV